MANNIVNANVLGLEQKEMIKEKGMVVNVMPANDVVCVLNDCVCKRARERDALILSPTLSFFLLFPFAKQPTVLERSLSTEAIEAGVCFVSLLYVQLFSFTLISQTFKRQ